MQTRIHRVQCAANKRIKWNEDSQICVSLRFDDVCYRVWHIYIYHCSLDSANTAGKNILSAQKKTELAFWNDIRMCLSQFLLFPWKNSNANMLLRFTLLFGYHKYSYWKITLIKTRHKFCLGQTKCTIFRRDEDR